MPPRRSKRGRKQVHTVYQDAEKEVEVRSVSPRKKKPRDSSPPPSKSSNKKKRDIGNKKKERDHEPGPEEEQENEPQEEEEEEEEQMSKAEQDKEEESDKEQEEADEDEQESEEEEKEEESSQQGENENESAEEAAEDEEEYTPRRPEGAGGNKKRRRGSSSPRNKTPPSSTQGRQQARLQQQGEQQQRSRRSKTPPKQQQQQHQQNRGGGTTRAPAARKGVQTALTALAKKFLDPEEEMPETSLVAALLYSGGKANGADNEEAAATAAEIMVLRPHYEETAYTRPLISIARRVYDDHAHDPNAAHVSLYNLLFRSVGATYEALLDSSSVDLENSSEEEMTEAIQTVVTSMEETPVEQVLLLADHINPVPTATAKGSSSSLAVQEYHRIYREFWYLLGVTALSDSLSGDIGSLNIIQKSKTPPSSSKKKKKTKNENLSDEEDDEEEEEHAASGAPQGFRFQIEMVREVLKRMIELSLLAQDDLRAGTTVAVYELAVAVLERTVELRSKLTVAERQLAVATKSRMKRKAEALAAQVDVWQRMCTELEGLVSDTVMGIFMKRYKDTHFTIRAESMRAMARFVITRPDLFFKNSYLKYLGWMLNDKSIIVRLQAVAGLLAPFKENQARTSSATTSTTSNKKRGIAPMDTSVMAGIAEKFAARLADCTMDVQVSVQEQAMELLLVFSREGLLDSIENERFWNQINSRALATDTSVTVRCKALQFILEQLEAFDTVVIRSETDAVERINSIATWITHCIGTNTIPLEKLPYDRVAFIVTSLRLCPEHVSLVENYSAMLRALKECGEVSASESKRRLEVIQRRVLLEMLVASVEQEMSGLDSLEPVVDPDLLAAQRAHEAVGSHNKKQQHQRKKKDGIQEKLTIAMLEALPELLASLKTETDLVRGLTTLPKYFLPSVLNTSSQRKHFSALLDQLSSLFLTATDQTVLFNCCLTMTLLAKGDHIRSSEALVVLKRATASICDELAVLLEEKAETVANDNDKEEDDPNQILDVELSISLCLRRLVIVSKRWPLSSLITGGLNAVEKLASNISKSVARDLNARIPVLDEENEDAEVTIPVIWKTVPVQVHEVVQDSAIAALSFLLSTTAWMLREKLLEEGEEREDAAMLVRMRDRISRLGSLCFEMFIDEDNDSYEQPIRLFSRAIQIHAMQITGDLSSLFPKEWSSSADPLLRASAFTEDTPLVGGSVRFLKTQGDKLRMTGEEEQEDNTNNYHKDISRALLLPIARGLCSNWRVGNRREAGTALPHIVGSGPEATAIISAMSRVLKKVDAVRLLEAHMAGFRQVYDDWAENEPLEPQSDNPTDEELDEFEEAEKTHRSKLELMEQQAKRLSSSLGVGKLSDKNLKPAMLGFVREGIRFAFSTEDPNGGEPLFLGARLPFLGIISKYFNWIRKDKSQLEAIRAVLNEKEAELRNHPGFEDVFEDDLKALSVFRQTCNLGSFLVEDDDEKTKDSESDAGREPSVEDGRMRRRMSHGSSVSSIVSKTSTQKTLSPLPEEEEKGNGDDDGEEGEEEIEDDDEKSHTSSISSKVRETSKATKRTPIEEGSEESSNPSPPAASKGKETEDEDEELPEPGSGSKIHEPSLSSSTPRGGSLSSGRRRSTRSSARKRSEKSK